MSFCFILAGTEDRAHLLERCVKCINANRFYSEADLYLYWQGDESQIPFKERFKNIVVAPELQGVFLPRYSLFGRYGLKYDYTILIDDDLYMYPDTDYSSAMTFLQAINNNGICNIGQHFDKRRNQLKMINYSKDNFNVCGGIVFPQKCVKVLVDYFAVTNPNVTEDIFWVLLYCKGFDLYRDFSSNALHMCHRPAKNGDASGYYKWRLEKPYIPLLPEYTNARLVKDDFGDRMRWKIPECRDVNEAGMAERKRCRQEMGLEG